MVTKVTSQPIPIEHQAKCVFPLDILSYLLPILPAAILPIQNASKSTALHWAATNKHLSIVQKLATVQPSLIDIKNAAGRTPLGEAELAEWDDGAQWMVGAMIVEDGDIKEGVTDEFVEDEDKQGKET